MYHIQWSDCPNAYVVQTGRQLSTRVKEHKGAVRRQDERATHLIGAGHPSSDHQGATKQNVQFYRDTTSTCINQCVILDPGFRPLRDYWRRRRQGHPPNHLNNFNARVEWDAALTSTLFGTVFILTYLSTRSIVHAIPFIVT